MGLGQESAPLPGFPGDSEACGIRTAKYFLVSLTSCKQEGVYCFSVYRGFISATPFPLSLSPSLAQLFDVPLC